MGDATWGKMHDASWTETKDLPAEVYPWLETMNESKMGKIRELVNSEQNGERKVDGSGARWYRSKVGGIAGRSLPYHPLPGGFP